MADLLNDLAQYLIEHELCSGIGVDIFLDYRPDEPDKVISLIEYGGNKPQQKVDAYSRKIQISLRDKNFENCKSQIWEIFNVLNNIEEDNEIITSSGRWMVTDPLQTPFRLNIDNQNRVIYVFNLGIATNKD